MKDRGKARDASGESRARQAGGRGFWVAGAALAVACGGEPLSEPVASSELGAQPAPNVDARRSLAVTDQPVLVNFTLKRVLDTIIASSGVPNLSATTLFQQWWDTQNPGPGLELGPHCNDAVEGGVTTLNGYPYTCRPASLSQEGAQASCDPFATGSPCAYIPVGLFMRFDLAPGSGAHCGEYRIVFAKESGRTQTANRNLVIFEAALRNPHANQGIRGCQRYVRAWAELSNEPNIATRRAALEAFYFTGYQEFDPVVTAFNYGDNPLGAGQVRTNQFVQPDAPRIWSLREFKIMKDAASSMPLKFVPVTDKVNPFGALFDPAATHPNATAFQSAFLDEIPQLASVDPNGIGMNTSDVFNSGQGQATSSTYESNFGANFGSGTNAFRTAIQNELTSIGSTLSPDDIVQRAQVTACAGCHRFSSGVDLGGQVTWPVSLGFTHVSERDVDLEAVAGVTRYKISDALVTLLLPHREQLVEDFLNDVPLPNTPPSRPIGGRWVH